MDITEVEFDVPASLAQSLVVPWSNNCVLRELSEVELSIQIVRQLGLLPHDDRPKNWDGLIALSTIVNSLDIRANILDAGAETYSKILPWLSKYGFHNLYAINPVFEYDFISGSILYEKADIEQTRFRSEFFDGITCLSVLEHGVDSQRYLSEAHRILRPGGLLITSVDYWESPVSCDGKRFFGVPVKIYSETTILEFISLAREIGFNLNSELDLKCKQRVVHWREMGLDFTFLIITLQKD